MTNKVHIEIPNEGIIVMAHVKLVLLMSKKTGLFLFFKRADFYLFIIPGFKNPLWNKRAILSPLTRGNRGSWAR